MWGSVPAADGRQRLCREIGCRGSDDAAPGGPVLNHLEQASTGGQCATDIAYLSCVGIDDADAVARLGGERHQLHCEPI